MEICGQGFNLEVIERISHLLRDAPGISMRELSRQVWEWLGWRAPNGKLKEMSCRKALGVLHRRGIIGLPERVESYGFQRHVKQGHLEGIEIGNVSCELSELGRIEMQPVSSRYSKASKTWKALMDNYHPLGSGPLCGAQLRYLIWTEGHGYLGALSFSSGTWELKERDKYIGWSQGARRSNLQRVLCNSRFLIVPGVRVPNLASHVLSRCARRIVQDWKARYAVEPVLLETFVDPCRFTGASYRAANWAFVGQTAGRRKRGGPKQIYLYPLCSRWREILSEEPEVRLGERTRAIRPVDWVEEELGTAQFYDPRLARRLFTLVRDFSGQPQAPVPEACGSLAKTKAAYRFFDNKKVTMDVVLRAHAESSVERIRKHPVALAVQDTTSFNYTTHPATKGLGLIGTSKDGPIGLLLHGTMAFTPDGTPLGLLDAQCWVRKPEEHGKKHLRKQLPIEQKESMKWLKSYLAVAQVQKLCPDTVLVSVGDREADIYELFWQAAQDPQGPKLLVRCEKSRKRKVGGIPLWQKMLQEPVCGIQEVRVARKKSSPARDAKLEVRYAQLTLKGPKNKRMGPVEVWVVYAREIHYSPKVKSPLEWMLLTTVEVRSPEDAFERLHWYSRRWGIEVYHRTLKSGCNIEERQLGSANRLESCLAIDMVVAWRIYHLTMLGRELPNVPCTVFFEEAQWKALWIFAKKTRRLPSKPPTLRDAIRMTTSLGGFLGRKGDGEPGTQTLWRGLQRLDDITAMYLALLPDLRAGP